MSENDQDNGGGTDSAANDTSDTSGTDMAANDIGSFDASISAADPQGALAATETHDTPSAGYDGATGSDLAAAGIAATETHDNTPELGSVGSLDLGAPEASETAGGPTVSLSDLIAVGLGAAGPAFAAARMFGQAAGAVALNNPSVQQGLANISAALAAGQQFANQQQIGANPFEIVQQFATEAAPAVDLLPAAPAPAPASLPVSPDPAFPPAVVAENTHLLMQLGFVPN